MSLDTVVVFTSVEPTRSGTSPIGTSSPNSGSTAATNSTYASGAFTSGIAQPSSTTYAVNNTDYQGIIIFNTSSAVTVTLNQAVRANFTCTILNLGTGNITLTPNGGLTVNGSSSLALGSHVGAQVFFANRAWLAYSGATSFPTVPTNTPSVSHEWLASYNASTGAFTQTQPTFSDVSGNLATSQLPTAGVSGTVTLAALTALGTQGSITFTNGICTAYVNPT